VDCIADLHGFFPELLGGDLLIIAGDLTARDEFPEYCHVFQKIAQSNYKKKILIGGNHDNLLMSDDWFAKMTIDFDYLCDSGTEFEGLRIWGSPWTKTFEGMNPKCKAFTCDTEEELASKFALIPNDIDILITHSPPYGILDSNGKEYCGSVSLRNITLDGNRFKKKKLHVFGHIHECGGMSSDYPGPTFCELDLCSGKFINASIVNEHYKHVNKSVRIIL
jgi:Icc-related predicted phosphoesterase